jgi:hypothetical protein
VTADPDTESVHHHSRGVTDTDTHIDADIDTGTVPVVRGAAFPTWHTLGEAATSDLGPTASNGFDTRWADDLGLLADEGAGAVRLALDWPRLQPAPGALDGGWTEWYTSLIRHARGIGLATWVTLHERGVPRWFDDEGGFDDDVAAGRSWPHWVERAADRFGDLVDGWIPLVPTVPNRRIVWRDTWSILRGGPPVMKTSTMPADRDLVEREAEARTGRDCDLVGIVLALAASHVAGADARRRAADRVGEWIRLVHDTGPGVPLAVASVEVGADDRAEHAAGLELARVAIEEAGRDVPAALAFATPAIDGGDLLGLYDRDRNGTASSSAWLD